MKIRLIASVLAVTLAAGVAGSAFAARPAPTPRNPFQPVVNELNDINRELALVLQRQASRDHFRVLVARLNALTKRIDQEESRMESLLAKEPVPPSAAVLTELEAVLAAANAIVQDAGTALAQDGSGWPQASVDALNGVEDAAQAIVDVVENSIGLIPS